MKHSHYSACIILLLCHQQTLANNIHSCSNIYKQSILKPETNNTLQTTPFNAPQLSISNTSANKSNLAAQPVVSKFDPTKNIDDAWAAYENSKTTSRSIPDEAWNQNADANKKLANKKPIETLNVDLDVFKSKPSLSSEIDAALAELKLNFNSNTSLHDKLISLDALENKLNKILNEETTAAETAYIKNIQYLVARFMQSDFASVENSKAVFGFVRRQVYESSTKGLSVKSIYELKRKIFKNSVEISLRKNQIIFSQFFINFIFDRWQDGIALKKGPDRALEQADFDFMEFALEHITSLNSLNNKNLDQNQLEIVIITLQDILHNSNSIGKHEVKEYLKLIRKYIEGRFFYWKPKNYSMLKPTGLTVIENGIKTHPNLDHRTAVKYLLLQLVAFDIITPEQKENIMEALKSRGTPPDIRDRNRELLSQLESTDP